ncbi:MAG: hypothetical protein C5B53_05895 [Candidatus Melainabacteria bacterium]|nr:MAG: hypothetical protein C5B53_05895 [Candidatus Melainabacteria bacterium]
MSSVHKPFPFTKAFFRRATLFWSCLVLSSTSMLSLAAEHVDKPANPPAVLPPENFTGRISEGYAAAKKLPDICSKLFCYCGCDKTDSHSSLLDCFTCDHAVDCTICLDEAIIARDLKKKGKSLSEIQKEIDQGFQTMYPWDQPTPALEKYRGSLKAGPVSPAADTAKSGKTESLLKLPAQPGDAKHRRYGGCCGHNHS